MSDERLKEIIRFHESDNDDGDYCLDSSEELAMARELLEFRAKHGPGKCAYLLRKGRGTPLRLEESDLDTIVEVYDDRA